MTDHIIFTHGPGCLDGWAASELLMRNVEDERPYNISIFPCQYGDPIPPAGTYAGRRVWIVDFSFPPDVMDAIADAAQAVIVMDHHQSAADQQWSEKWTRFDSMAEFVANTTWDWSLQSAVCVIDQTRSGVGLVAQWVGATSGGDPPSWIGDVERRDLWQHQDVDGNPEVIAAISSHPLTAGTYTKLEYAAREVLVEEGRAINRYRNQLIDQIAASTFQFCLRAPDDSGIVVPCVASPYSVGSDVAGRLAEESPTMIGGYCILHLNEVQIGLRSRGNGPDVAKIAEWYGGGGHRNASGFRVDHNSFFMMLR